MKKDQAKSEVEVLHLFRWFTHTHTLPREGGKFKGRTMRWKWNWKEMKVRWRWKWDESYLTRTRRGERKRRGAERTPTRHTWPGAGKPWTRSGQTLERAREKKSGGRRTRDKTSGGGGRRKRLNQPNTAKTYAYLGTRRTQPTWRGESTWNRGPMGD